MRRGDGVRPWPPIFRHRRENPHGVVRHLFSCVFSQFLNARAWVKSRDAASNLAISADQTFTATVPPAFVTGGGGDGGCGAGGAVGLLVGLGLILRLRNRHH
jgi:hypothetical protein